MNAIAALAITEIVATARAFEAARVTGADDARTLWYRLGESIASAGFAAVILDGTFYHSPVMPEADGDDFGTEVFPARLILDLDAGAGR